MSKLDYFVVVDCASGTFFGADNAFLLDTRKLSEDQLDILNNGANDERGSLAEQLGIDMEEIDILDPADELVARYGSWGQDERYPRIDWRREVSEGDTNLGYWDWLLQQYDIHDEEESDDCPRRPPRQLDANSSHDTGLPRCSPPRLA
jgi:hypothetical protein